MSNAINPKGSRLIVPGTGAMHWVTTYLGSTVGQKILIAITGASLVLFVTFHLIGNLKVFNGPAAINHYANFLKHDLGLLIWIARAGLLGAFGLHLVLAITLKLKSVAARPVGYFHQRSVQATPQSKTMIWTGIVILMFVLFHLAHYTFAWVHTAPNGQNYLELKDDKGYHDVYAMLIAGFQSWWISILYLIAQSFLFVHLAHGIQSVFQTLGLVGPKFTPAVKLLGYGLSGLIFVGNSAIVLAVLLGRLK
jgi:succinate dehydrogenase / fumarate reductase, cytochrome b subunit